MKVVRNKETGLWEVWEHSHDEIDGTPIYNIVDFNSRTKANNYVKRKKGEERFRVIIAGGRTFIDFELMCSKCDAILKNKKNVEVVSGTARGADDLGERYAVERCYDIKQFPADWDKYGKSAGYKRNKQMAEYGDALIAFWDGISKGTKHMIDLAKENNLPVRIIKY